MMRRAGVFALIAVGALLAGVQPAAAQGGLCNYMPQVRNFKFEPDQSINEKLDRGCFILFDEYPETLGMQSITIERLRTTADAAQRLKGILYDDHLTIDRLGDEGYDYVFSEGTQFYGVLFRRGVFVVNILGSGMRGSVIPVFTRLAREMDEKLPRGDASVSPPPVPPPVPPTVTTPAPAPAPASPGTGSGTGADAAEKALLEALVGAECNNLANMLLASTDKDERETAYAEAAKVSRAYRDLIANSTVSTPWAGPADRALTHLVTLGSLEDADGKAIFPSVRASVAVAAKLAVAAAADEGAFIALRRLLALLIRMDRPCP